MHLTSGGGQAASVLQSFYPGGRRYTVLLGSGAFGYAWNPENLPLQLLDNPHRVARPEKHAPRFAWSLRVKSIPLT